MGEPAILQQYTTFSTFRIAGLTVAIAGANVLRELGHAYLIEGGPKTDISIDVTDDVLWLKQNSPNASMDKCAYISSARRFYESLLSFDGFVLHASAVVLDGKAYLFSADSGTGKSTHTSLWCTHFGRERAYILNDDKPIIRKINGRYHAYGAPWCGSSGLNANECVPIQGIAFIERCEYDWIKPMPQKDALRQLLQQSDPNVRQNAINILLTLYNDLLVQVPIYRMGCTISDNAVLTSSKTMSVNARELACLSII